MIRILASMLTLLIVSGCVDSSEDRLRVEKDGCVKRGVAYDCGRNEVFKRTVWQCPNGDLIIL